MTALPALSGLGSVAYIFAGPGNPVTYVAGSFFLTPATALRYERHDNKVKHVSQEEALNVGKNKRRVDMKEEYYVCP